MIPVTRVVSVLLALILSRFGVLGWAEKTTGQPWIFRYYGYRSKFIQ